MALLHHIIWIFQMRRQPRNALAFKCNFYHTILLLARNIHLRNRALHGLGGSKKSKLDPIRPYSIVKFLPTFLNKKNTQFTHVPCNIYLGQSVGSSLKLGLALCQTKSPSQEGTVAVSVGDRGNVTCDIRHVPWDTQYMYVTHDK